MHSMHSIFRRAETTPYSSPAASPARAHTHNHITQGVSRSAAIVIAYLIRKHNMTYDNAFAFVKQRRCCIKPNAGFVRCLREWEDRWRPAPTRQNSYSASPASPKSPSSSHPSSPTSPHSHSHSFAYHGNGHGHGMHSPPITMTMTMGPPSQPPITMNLKIPLGRARSAAPVRDGRPEATRIASGLGSVRPDMARAQSHQAVASPTRSN